MSSPRTDPPTLEAERFLESAERELLDRSIETQQAEWVYATYITPETEALAARANARLIAATVAIAKRAVPLATPDLPGPLARRLRLLRLVLPLVAPSDADEAKELTRIVAALQGAYGRARYRPAGRPDPLPLEELEQILKISRDPAQLADVWTGWHAIGAPMRRDFARYVELGNRGAREVGFPDMGAMWRSKYDMAPDAFAREVDRLWEQVRPFYLSLHTYVRRRLREEYGESVVPRRGPIPAHLLGNMWAQDWVALLPRLAPAGSAPAFDLTALLGQRTTDPVEVVRYAERFFSSLGFDPLPASFWERSMFARPADRDVVCHASAWDLDFVDDLRIKMCIDIDAEDFRVIHHELGHCYYQRAYNHQPFVFRDSAHDGFHEAIGDAIALSVTPEYLVRIGLLDRAPGPEGDLGLLLERALEKVAFLPFGLLIDQWRWKVFAEEIRPEEFNRSWWEMRRRYQGVAPPAPRGEEAFDPGAKYHIPANVPYMRYFLAHILQFQFHRGLVRGAGGDGPLHRRSIYGERAAGERLRQMLSMGMSRPWPEALRALTGEDRMDAGALLEYFAPLRAWLDEQNDGEELGW